MPLICMYNSNIECKSLNKVSPFKLFFNEKPDSKHTKTCNGADELAFGNLGRCLGSL